MQYKLYSCDNGLCMKWFTFTKLQQYSNWQWRQSWKCLRYRLCMRVFSYMMHRNTITLLWIRLDCAEILYYKLYNIDVTLPVINRVINALAVQTKVFLLLRVYWTQMVGYLWILLTFIHPHSKQLRKRELLIRSAYITLFKESENNYFCGPDSSLF